VWGIARKVARVALEDSSTCIMNTPTPMKYMPSGSTPGCPPPLPSPPTSGGAGALNAAFATSASSSTRPAAARSQGCSCDALKEPRFTAPDGIGDDGDESRSSCCSYGGVELVIGCACTCRCYVAHCSPQKTVVPSESSITFK
jgi:hypothetical protein